MDLPQFICDPRHIEACLAGALNDRQRDDFEAHLEVCTTCREALESHAAQPADWREVRQFLSSHEVPYAPGERSSATALHAISFRSSDDGAADGDGGEAAAIQNEAVDGVLNALAPTDDPHMLGRLGPYEIAGVVGRGGMGVVLKALDPALNRFVAIKVLAPQLATTGAARQRFAREARAAASVVHENVVAIHAVADGRSLPYFVMPYLRGASLQKRLDADGPLGIAEILRVSIQIAAGLSAAHAQGLVHRDIKPANILLEDGVERLKITDFGLARAVDDASLTRTGVIAGTPQFMSPEQARGELVDSRSDLFSLASVMYAMCTARPPFRSETSYGTLQRICDAQPRAIREINPEIPPWLTAFIGRLHEKNPDDRYQTAHEVAQLLEQCLAHLRQPDTVPLPPAIMALADANSSTSTQQRADGHSDRSPSLRRAASIFARPFTNFFIDRPAMIGVLATGFLVAIVAGTWLWIRLAPHDADSARSPVIKLSEAPQHDDPTTPLPESPIAQSSDSPIELTVTGPGTARVGSDIAFDIKIFNRGTEPMSGLSLTDRFGRGLQHQGASGNADSSPIRRDLDAIGPIAAGMSRDVQVQFHVVDSGKLYQVLEIHGAAGKLASKLVFVIADGSDRDNESYLDSQIFTLKSDIDRLESHMSSMKQPKPLTPTRTESKP